MYAVIDAEFGSSVPEGGVEKEEKDDQEPDGMVGGSAGTTNSNSAESIHHQQGQGTGGCSTPVQPRTASIRSRPTSSRITAAELEELFQRQQGCSNGNCPLRCRVETKLSLGLFLQPTLMHNSITNMYVRLLSSTCFGP